MIYGILWYNRACEYYIYAHNINIHICMRVADGADRGATWASAYDPATL